MAHTYATFHILDQSCKIFMNPRWTYYGAADLYNMTPYADTAYRDKYLWDRKQEPAEGRWRVARFPHAVPVDHFKWHAGVLRR